MELYETTARPHEMMDDGMENALIRNAFISEHDNSRILRLDACAGIVHRLAGHETVHDGGTRCLKACCVAKSGGMRACGVLIVVRKINAGLCPPRRTRCSVTETVASTKWRFQQRPTRISFCNTVRIFRVCACVCSCCRVGGTNPQVYSAVTVDRNRAVGFTQTFTAKHY